MSIPNECIIIGGGPSIKEGLSLGLKERIKDKFVITCNFAFNHFDGTFEVFVDRDFYTGRLNTPNDLTINNDHVDKIKALPLIVGHLFDNRFDYYPNTIALKQSREFDKSAKKGFYSSFMCGFFALHVAMYLMNYIGTIYILGYDWTKRDPKTICPTTYTPYDNKTETHYYSDSEIKHRGQHWLSAFENHDAHQYFVNFLIPGIKVYNVSLNSNIFDFEKISYPKMLELLSPETFNQEELRKEIKAYLH